MISAGTENPGVIGYAPDLDDGSEEPEAPTLFGVLGPIYRSKEAGSQDF